MKFTPKTHQLRGYSDDECEWGILADDMGGIRPLMIRTRRIGKPWMVHLLREDGYYVSEVYQSKWDLIPRVPPHNIPHNLPEAILYVTMDGDGLVYGWHNEKPYKGEFTWYGDDAMHLPQWAYGPILDGWDWKESLHKRNDEGEWDRGYFKRVGEG